MDQTGSILLVTVPDKSPAVECKNMEQQMMSAVIFTQYGTCVCINMFTMLLS